MDLIESKDKNEVTATFELPGLRREDVRIDVQQNRLTVSGEAKTSEEHQEGDYAVRERLYGKFSRTLQLPVGTKVRPLYYLRSCSRYLQPEEVKAKMENGILSVTFPKVGKEQEPKRIAVQ